MARIPLCTGLRYKSTPELKRLNHRLCHSQREFVPVPRPKAGARFNNAKEGKKQADKEESEPIGVSK